MRTAVTGKGEVRAWEEKIIIRCLCLLFCISMTWLPVHAEKIDADKAEKIALRYVQTKRHLHTGEVVHLKNIYSQRRRMSMESNNTVQDTVFYHVFNINVVQ